LGLQKTLEYLRAGGFLGLMGGRAERKEILPQWNLEERYKEYDNERAEKTKEAKR